MDDEREGDSELELVPTEELLGELANRYTDMVFVGRSAITEDAGMPMCGVTKFFHGDQFACAGLAHDAINCVIGTFKTG